MMLDDKDRRIIEILKSNSRLSVRDIGKSTRIRPSTVHQRIKKLIEKKVIEKFTIKLSNKEMDENFIVFMLVNTKKDIDSAFMNKNYVKEVFGVTGEYDLILKLKFKDVEEFNQFVISFRKEQNVRETLTMVATANLKEEI